MTCFDIEGRILLDFLDIDDAPVERRFNYNELLTGLVEMCPPCFDFGTNTTKQNHLHRGSTSAIRIEFEFLSPERAV